LFERLADLQPAGERVECEKSVQLEMPSPDELAKLLIAGRLQSAEVVELADTPSARIALEILYKLLIMNLLPFASITSANVPRSGQ
jgi:hypothetical protein